ncbi:MAG: ketopantoate reductase family protein [Promethearchaeota archaeon]
MSIIINIGILGAGSIGSLFGGRLAALSSERFNLKITFICRKRNAEAINQNGLIFKFQEKEMILTNILAVDDATSLESHIFDYLFLSTKAYDSAATLEEYKMFVNTCKSLVILQNGIGNEEIVSEYCEKSKIIRCVTTEGAALRSAGHLIHTGLGFTKIGFPFIQQKELIKAQRSRVELLHELLSLAGFNTYISNDIIGDCWEKVFVNIGINPFGALTRLKNGDLLKSEALKELMAEAVREATKVAKKKGIFLPDRDYIKIMFDVARKTAENQNSMLQDILKQKKTEIDFINGRIVKYAKDLNIDVPINALLTALVERLESSYKFRSSDLIVIK